MVDSTSFAAPGQGCLSRIQSNCLIAGHNDSPRTRQREVVPKQEGSILSGNDLCYEALRSAVDDIFDSDYIENKDKRALLTTVLRQLGQTYNQMKSCGNEPISTTVDSQVWRCAHSLKDDYNRLKLQSLVSHRLRTQHVSYVFGVNEVLLYLIMRTLLLPQCRCNDDHPAINIHQEL
jgi:uncharacterized protein YerC